MSDYQLRLMGKGVGFQRINRITGYLVHDLSQWGSAKLAELNSRIGHDISGVSLDGIKNSRVS